MKRQPPPLLVGKPCTQRWQDLAGDGKRRFCEHCQLHVHNLSAMPARELERFVAESCGTECITYKLRQDGTMITRTIWSRLAAPLLLVRVALMTLLATALPFLFSACASRRVQMGSPIPRDGKETKLPGHPGEPVAGRVAAPPRPDVGRK